MPAVATLSDGHDDHDPASDRRPSVLAEIASTLDGADFAAERIRRVLVLARELVPSARCALLAPRRDGQLELTCVPELGDAAGEAMRARLVDVLSGLRRSSLAEIPRTSRGFGGHLLMAVTSSAAVLGVLQISATPAIPRHCWRAQLLADVVAMLGDYLAAIT